MQETEIALSVTEDVVTPEPKKSKPKTISGIVTYFNEGRMVVGFEASGIGYQCHATKIYQVGEKIRFVNNNGGLRLK